MFTLRDLIRVVFAAMLAIGLAACGGGSSTMMESTDHYAEAMKAVDAAEMAVGGLNDMSTDEEVSAAMKLIDTAKMAVGDEAMLTDEQRTGLSGRIMAAEESFGAKQTYRAAMSAVDTATMAVGELTAMSTDDDVDGADKLLEAADTAVMAGTSLTEGERELLQGKIAIARLELIETRKTIQDYRTHETELTTATEAVTMAEQAVKGLTVMSTDDDVTGADNLLEAADTAVMAGTSLTEDEKSNLNDRIQAARTDYNSIGMQISDRKDKEVADELVRLFRVATNATADAAAALKKAQEAVTKASTASTMLTIYTVNGNSARAVDNAQAVLDANEEVEQALVDAQAVKRELDAALKAANDLAEGTEGKEEVVMDLKDADPVVQGDIVAIEAIIDLPATDTGSLASFVQMVTGTSDTDPITPADVGREVADRVFDALNSNDSDIFRSVAGLNPGRNRVLPEEDRDERIASFDDGAGMTWAEIVDNTVAESEQLMERVGSQNRIRLLVNIDDMTGTDVQQGLTSGETAEDGSTFTREAGTPDPMYMGIPGSVFCLSRGDACSVNEDGVLTGGWYFTPAVADLDDVYVLGANGEYEEEGAVNEWGYWLNTAGATANPTAPNAPAFFRYYLVRRNQFDHDWGFTAGGTQETSATYSGAAVGVSVRRTFGSDGSIQSAHSGEFVANARLTAQFGSSPMLSGTIDHFRAVDEGAAGHVNSEWSVTLTETVVNPLEAGDSINTPIVGVNGVGGSTIGHDAAPNGVWNAMAWGDDGERPAGIIGDFDGRFTEGRAMGVFSTTRDE